MTALVDTNVLVRHLTGRPPGQARRATRFLESAIRAGDAPIVLDVIVAELVYVLQSVYELDRREVSSRLRGIVGSGEVQVADEDLLLRTIEIFESVNIGFADACLVATAERSGVNAVVSFDRGIDRVGTVERIEP